MLLSQVPVRKFPLRFDVWRGVIWQKFGFSRHGVKLLSSEVHVEKFPLCFDGWRCDSVEVQIQLRFLLYTSSLNLVICLQGKFLPAIFKSCWNPIVSSYPREAG